MFGDHGVLDHRFGGLEQIVDAARQSPRAAHHFDHRTVIDAGIACDLTGRHFERHAHDVDAGAVCTLARSLSGLDGFDRA